ncbi:MAG TPA: two-component regulator propeller domain-containing protein, partial [Anaerolineae bacterium]|nr:two-component regulator propeller domain-containing protein [Anaerolineae bacterium]
ETFTPMDGLADDDVYSLALDSQQRVWMATYGGGIFVLDHGSTPFDKSDDTWTSFTTSDGLVSNSLYALALDEESRVVWAGSWGGGVSRLDYGGTVEDKSDDTWTDLVTADALPGNSIWTLLPSGHHTWVGTTNGGFAATDGENWTAYSTVDGLVSNAVYAFAEEEDLLWIGTAGGINNLDDGGTPYDREDDTWTSFRTTDGLNTPSVRALDFDRAEYLWAASTPQYSSGGQYVEGGLSVLDHGGTPFDKSDDSWMTYHPEDSGGLFNAWAYDIAVDGAQRVWAATYRQWDGSQYVGGGLVLLDHASTPFDKSDDAWTVFTTADGLSSDYAYAVALDGTGQIWVGTGYGLNVLDIAGTPFDKSDDTWTTFYIGDGLASNDIRGLSLDRMDRLWVSTGMGLSALDTAGSPHDKTDDVWLTYKVADGLVDNYLYATVTDSAGAVWVGTSGGLSRMRGAVRFQTYLPLSNKG